MVELIVVPYVLGHEGTGMGAGPLALQEAAVDALDAVRVEQLTLTVPFVHEIGACFDLNRQVARAVAAARGRGALPVVLTGNCNTQVGVVAGAGVDGLGLVWLDCHADFHTLDTTASGFFDGTALSLVVGDEGRALCATVPGHAPLPGDRVVLAGARDIDPGERARLEASAVTELRAADIGRLADALPAAPRISLHLDLDVLDAAEGRANAYAAPGGITRAQLADVVRTVGAERELAALTLSAYDPACDADRRVHDAAIGALRSTRPCDDRAGA